MIHDKISNWLLYFNSAPWRCAFEFLGSLSTASEDSPRIALQGDDMYAAIMLYQTCLPEESVLETHDEYIDIQMSLVNSEAIDWFPRQTLEIKVPYSTERDRNLYHRPVIAPARVSNYPAFFTVLQPDDAHMPKLMTADNSELVKKVVVKVHKKLIL